MRPRDVIELLVLSVLWGGAYLFTRAAVPAFGPGPLVCLRLGLAALVLLPILASEVRHQLRQVFDLLSADLAACHYSKDI